MKRSKQCHSVSNGGQARPDVNNPPASGSLILPSRSVVYFNVNDWLFCCEAVRRGCWSRRYQYVVRCSGHAIAGNEPSTASVAAAVRCSPHAKASLDRQNHNVHLPRDARLSTSPTTPSRPTPCSDIDVGGLHRLHAPRLDQDSEALTSTCNSSSSGSSSGSSCSSAAPMHRAAVRVFRTTTTTTKTTSTSTSLTTIRSLSRSSRAASAAWRRSTALRTSGRTSFSFFSAAGSSAVPRPPPSSRQPLRSSMYFRRLPVALAGLVAGYGAWYTYNSTSSLAGSHAPGARSFTSTQTDAAPAHAPTRTVLVVGADELRQGTIVGEGPILKGAAGDGSHVVEMLTPEQVTQKLRKLEQSFSVNRGQGVTRYDLVQLPSNDPIEDDHAEKIVQVPTRTPGVEGGSDWMFWGVFDGHS